MNEDQAIRVKNLGKCYRIGAQEQYKTLREAISNAVKVPFNRVTHNLSPKSLNLDHNYIWALRGISFEVERGDVVGIIGRNGCGKSTLLKILSRITPPTEGSVELHGRVGSLLEVGTGFHPELTGRENIYLSGSIQGMKKSEIEDRFDDIIKFSEIEKFLDTPIKRYSSGMYVRLAFAVAAHLDPEILLVDEVLAVGDASFQKKCMGKMGKIAKEGRTILFVSHNMGAISTFCKTGLFINDGRLAKIGDISSIVSNYLEFLDSLANNASSKNSKEKLIYLEKWGIGKPGENSEKFVKVGEDLHLWIKYGLSNKIDGDLLFVITLRDLYDNLLVVVHNELENYKIKASGLCGVVCASIKNLNFKPGNYKLNLEIKVNGILIEDVPLGNMQIVMSAFFLNGEIFNDFPALAIFKSEWIHKDYSE
jgi:lipopolysaccharide transport system ATP-binding protein